MRRRVPGLGLLLAAAGLLRVAAARDDLWLDEIWSLTLASRVHRALDVFTALHHDNNHYLVTLWMFLLGQNVAGFWHRLPSLVAGLASVALVAAAGRRLGRTAGIFAAVLTAFSLPLVVYSSEARGYAPAVCFSLAAFLLLHRLLERGRLSDALLFGLVGVLGVLSHLTFIHVLLAGAVWVVFRIVTQSAALRVEAPPFAAAFAPPVLALALLWAVDLRYLEVGGGDPAASFDVVRRVGSLLLGGPDDAATGAVLLPLVWLGVVLGLYRLRRSDPGAALFLLAAVAIPSLSLAVPRFSFLHPRYLLVSMPFVFLALAVLLDGLWEHGRVGKAIAAACLAAILGGDARQLAVFLRDGRGHYSDAVRLMASGVSGSSATVASDQDFRNGLVVEYYARRLVLPRPVIYIRHGEEPPGGPDWILTHSGSPSPVRPDALTDAHGNRYVFVKDYPFAALSGFSWSLFRNAARTSP
jgi:hypothetical protein